jgi:hypothetical protein
MTCQLGESAIENDNNLIKEKTTIMPTDFLTEPANRRQTNNPDRDTSAKVVSGGSGAELIGGAGALVLAIIGLAGILPRYMAGIAALAIGAGLLLQGVAIAARYASLRAETGGGKTGAQELSAGMTTEMIGGCAGIVLGILALLGVVPLTLLSVAAIVFGGTLLFGSGATVRLAHESAPGENPTARQATEHTTEAAGGSLILVGIGAATLGILALVGVAPMVLILVSMLTVGAATLLNGSAITSRMVSVLNR